MSANEVTFSQLQLQGKATVERLRRSPAQALLVRRHDAEDLVLTTAGAGGARAHGGLGKRVFGDRRG